MLAMRFSLDQWVFTRCEGLPCSHKALLRLRVTTFVSGRCFDAEKEWSQKVERITQTQAFPFVLLLVLIILFFYVVKPGAYLYLTHAVLITFGRPEPSRSLLSGCCLRSRQAGVYCGRRRPGGAAWSQEVPRLLLPPQQEGGTKPCRQRHRHRHPAHKRGGRGPRR